MLLVSFSASVDPSANIKIDRRPFPATRSRRAACDHPTAATREPRFQTSADCTDPAYERPSVRARSRRLIFQRCCEREMLERPENYLRPVRIRQHSSASQVECARASGERSVGRINARRSWISRNALSTSVLGLAVVPALAIAAFEKRGI